MRRHFLAAGISALCMALTPALALGQDNTASAPASAGAVNTTGQGISQAGGGEQTADQSAHAIQLLPIAVAPAVAPQVAPININLPIRLLSPGENGTPAQSNTAEASAEATNVNSTDQEIRQSGGASDPKGGAGSQSATQEATAIQIVPVAIAPAIAGQVAPINLNAPIRIASPGDDAGAEQSNTASAPAEATNVNAIDQLIRQSGDDKKGGAVGSQTASQSAHAIQLLPIALAPAVAAQVLPINANLPIRILSPGDNPAPAQSNTASAPAEATNVNAIDQGIGQWGGGSQSATQEAFALQLLPIALAPAIAAQVLPVNLNAPVSLLDELPPLPVDPFALLADPLGTVTGVVGAVGGKGGPLSAVTGLVGGLPLVGGLLPAVTGLAGGLPLVGGLLPSAAPGLAPTALPDPLALVTGLVGGLPLVGGLLPTVTGLVGGLPLVGGVLPTVTGLLADPFGAVTGLLADPFGAVFGLVGSLPLPVSII